MRLTNHDPDYQPYVISANEPTWRAIYDKLCEYEDAEESGLLVRLPCKVGDTVYRLSPVFDEIESGKITMIQQKADGTWKFRVTTDFSHDVTTDAIGKTVFLSREAAEAALKGEREDV